MLDLNYILNNIEEIDQAYQNRGFAWNKNTLLVLAQTKKDLQTKIENLRANANKVAQDISKNKNDTVMVEQLKKEGERIKNELVTLEPQLEQNKEQLDNLLLHLPNIPQKDVPIGKDDKNNLEVHRWGTPTHETWHKEHDEIGKLIGLDAALGAKLSGTRFTVLRKDMATLHRALVQFMLNEHIKAGYEEVYVPYLVKEETMRGTGQLPKFQEDMFHLEKDNLYLIPTAEVPVTNLLANELVKMENLPYNFVAHTPCFRREVGSAGRDTKGMIRQHQFDKIEIVKIVKPEDSEKELEVLVNQAKHILEALQLPYRQVVLCTGDMGFGSRKTYDLEVWLPGQNTYREISSVSNFGDFQARRMGLRAKDGKKKVLPHTLNGSALAVGRTLVAIIENYQQKDGTVKVPEVLKPWMNGVECINKIQ